MQVAFKPSRFNTDAVVCLPYPEGCRSFFQADEPNSAEGVDDLRRQLTLDIVADVFWFLANVELVQVDNGNHGRHLVNDVCVCLSAARNFCL